MTREQATVYTTPLGCSKCNRDGITKWCFACQNCLDCCECFAAESEDKAWAEYGRKRLLEWAKENAD